MGLLLEPESILRETHRIQDLVYLFTLQGSGQAPLWYTPEKITVPKAWFTGSICLALAISLEYILEVFLSYFSIPVSEFTSCGAPPRARIYSGSGQVPLWYTPEKITVPKAWFTGSTCLALASSLEYILEVFLFYFSASFQSLVGFQLRDTSLNPERVLQPHAIECPEGYISVTDWCNALEETTHLGLPWRMLKDKLVRTDKETRKVRYMDTFDLNATKNGRKADTQTVVETLYKNKRNLEAIFKILDKDNSGFITLEEFSEACQLIGKYMPNPMTQEQLVDICRLMDINKDGLVDLNEFLESFRLAEKSLHYDNELDEIETT
ncbi:hypothetical protein EVAR_31986_1 [Eumeta japonica]|uniref:EF-hand domain-containing protein n=1 Tax=Eumeta variegata TaxID=151549 RepID=A0A4C1VRE6_EUMVA|nr:hypothetical protein EVAR_31986_1 [Eumeta japonica]